MAEKLFENPEKRDRAYEALRDLVIEAHDNALEHGFYNAHIIATDVLAGQPPEVFDSVKRDFVLSQIAKTASELGEAVDAIQHHGVGNVKLLEELSDAVIRTFDLAGYLGAPGQFASTLLGKMMRNRARPYLHGKLC